MTISQIQLEFAGQTNVNPRLGRIVCDDNLSTITTAGYLNSNAGGYAFYPTDMLAISYAGGEGFFTLSFGANNVITLAETGTSVTLPTVANDIAIFSNTTGTLADSGIPIGNVPASPAVLLAPTGDQTITGNYTLTLASGAAPVFNQLNISDSQGTGIRLGNSTVALGISGTRGGLLNLYPLGGTGVFQIANYLNTYNTIDQLKAPASNPQNTAYSIPTSLAGLATVHLLSDGSANTMQAGAKITAFKVNGTEAANAVTASGMSGILTTSSLSTAAGSSYSIVWTSTFITSTSSILLTVSGGTNTTENITLKCIPGSGSATLTIYNNDPLAALNGTLLITYLVI